MLNHLISLYPHIFNTLFQILSLYIIYSSYLIIWGTSIATIYYTSPLYYFMDRRVFLIHPSALLLSSFLEIREFNPALMSEEAFLAITRNYSLISVGKHQGLSLAGHLTIKDAVILYDEECPICQDPLEERVVRLPCDHYFHKPCINKWFTERNTCPICRKDLNP